MAALRFIHPERLRRRMLHCAGVLASHLVVGNPAVLRGRFAVLGEIWVLVDLALWIIILHPSNMPQVAYVHIQALKRDAPINKAIQLVGFDLCVSLICSFINSMESPRLLRQMTFEQD